MKRTFIFLVLSVILIPIYSQTFQELRMKGYFLSLGGAIITDPIIRSDNSGFDSGDEMPIPQSKPCLNFKAGYEYLEKNWGAAINFTVWNRVKPDRYLGYFEPTYFNWFFDFNLYGILPLSKSTAIGLYGFTGFGYRTTSYIDYDNDFFKSSEFMFSYGPGLRFYLHNWFSLFIEARAVPGDYVTTYVGGVETSSGFTNTTEFYTLGITVNLSRYEVFREIDPMKLIGIGE